MKRILFAMMALVVLLASCSKEETPGQVYGDESLVTFTLSTGDLATKTAGDGTTAKQLYYAVYDAAGGMVEQISANAEPAAMSNSGAQVEMSLLNGQTYSIIFWAQNETAPCTIDWTAKTMKYEPKLANQESYDAFFAYVAPFKVTGAKTEKVELKRPFAQLNIGTTDGDLVELAKYHQKGNYTQAKVTVEKLPNVLNLVTGEATGEVTAVYDYANIDLLKDETFPVAGDKQYLAMNYVLQSTNQTVAVTLDVKSDQDHIVSRTFGNVPVKRNYKTNIYGDLYASTFAYDVEVAPDFNDTHYQTLSGVIKLEEDMEITRPLVIAAGDEAIINLNGHKIVNKNESNYNGDVFTVRGKLTIKGDGEINAALCAIYARGEAEVNIYGGTFIGSNTTDGGCETIYARDNAKVNIYGGTYEAISPYDGKTWVLNLQDSGSPAINVYGGEFKKFNPAIPGTEPVDWNTAHANGFVADGYKSTQVGENYIVTEESVDVVTTAKGINDAVSAGHSVLLGSDLTLAETITLSQDLAIDLNGKTLDASLHSSRPFEMKNANLTITAGKSAIKVGKYGLVKIVEGNVNVVLEGGIYEGETDKGAFLKVVNGAKAVNLTLKDVQYTDKSGNGYVLNAAGAESAVIVANIEGGKYSAGFGGFQGLCGGSLVKDIEIKISSKQVDGDCALEFEGGSSKVENSVITAQYDGIGAGFGAAVEVKGCTVKAENAFVIYTTGAEINVTGGSYTGKEYIHPSLEAGKKAKITVDGAVKAEKN